MVVSAGMWCPVDSAILGSGDVSVDTVVPLVRLRFIVAQLGRCSLAVQHPRSPANARTFNSRTSGIVFHPNGGTTGKVDARVYALPVVYRGCIRFLLVRAWSSLPRSGPRILREASSNDGVLHRMPVCSTTAKGYISDCVNVGGMLGDCCSVRKSNGYSGSLGRVANRPFLSSGHIANCCIRSNLPSRPRTILFPARPGPVLPGGARNVKADWPR